jgi:hypothetical protein
MVEEYLNLRLNDVIKSQVADYAARPTSWTHIRFNYHLYSFIQNRIGQFRYDRIFCFGIVLALVGPGWRGQDLRFGSGSSCFVSGGLPPTSLNGLVMGMQLDAHKHGRLSTVNRV